MKKALLYGENSLLAEVIAEYKDVFDFMPILHISEGINSEVVINSLTQNVDIGALRKIDGEILGKSFDIGVPVGNVTKLIKEYCKTPNYSFGETDSYVARKKMSISLKSQDINDEYVFICKIVRKIRSLGFRVIISTNNSCLSSMINIMRQDENPDIELYFDSNSLQQYFINLTKEVIESQRDIVVETVISKCKKTILKRQWVDRDLKLFGEKDFYNIHLIQAHKKQYVFKSCNHSTFFVDKKMDKLIKAYYNNNIRYLNKCTYKELFAFSEIRYYEREKACQFETLFSFPYLKIENKNDFILSYLGQRKCNLSCDYCFSDHEFEELPQLSRTDIVKTANCILKGNQNLKVHVDNYIGGEPCLDFPSVKDLYYTMFQYQKANGIEMSFGFLTNGTVLNEKQLLWLKDNVPYIGFSLDGDKITNDSIRHDVFGKGSYENVKKSIEKIRKMNWPVEIGISCVLTANNVNVKDLFLHFIDDLGVNNIVIKPVRAPEDSEFALTMKNIEKLKTGYKELFNFLFEKAKSGDIKYLKSMLMPLDYAGRFFIRTFLEDRVVVKRCGSGEHIFSVGNDLCVYGCDSFNGNKEAFLMDIKDGKYSDKYVVPFVTKERFGCDKCWARYMCGGVCQYVQHVNKYKINSVTMFECELAKFLIEEAIAFWAVAYNEFSPKTLDEIAEHIKNIGFCKYKNRDSFYYAPC